MSDATSSPFVIGELPTACRFDGGPTPHGKAAGPNADILSEQPACIDRKVEVNERVVSFFLDAGIVKNHVSHVSVFGLFFELFFAWPCVFVKVESLSCCLFVIVQHPRIDKVYKRRCVLSVSKVVIEQVLRCLQSCFGFVTGHYGFVAPATTTDHGGRQELRGNKYGFLQVLGLLARPHARIDAGSGLVRVRVRAVHIQRRYACGSK